MRRVRSKDTAPEMRVRRALHARGYRFRVHRKDLPGTPDIVLPRFRMCIFVNGCFWHGHERCKRARLPETRKEYWFQKIAANKERDQKSRSNLEQDGWVVATIWECETTSIPRLTLALDEIGLTNQNPHLTI